MLIPDPRTLEAELAADAHDSQWSPKDLAKIVEAHVADDWTAYTADEYIAKILSNIPPDQNA